MSHLKHINEFKLALVDKGVMNPETQIEFTRTAYVCAFVRFFSLNHIHPDKQEKIMRYMLGYWNETFPVKGLIVIALVNKFYLRLFSTINTIQDKIDIKLVNDINVELCPDYAQMATYEQLVNTLIHEIEHKHPMIKEV